MAKVHDIQLAIESLSDEEYASLRRWFSERDWAKWARQIETDSAEVKLDFLINEARDGLRRL
jgi:hypothetical protein